MMRFALIPEFQVQEAGDGARAQAADQERGLQAGGRDAYFAKPFSPSARSAICTRPRHRIRLRSCSLLAEHPLDAVQHYRDVTAYVDLDETKTTFLKAASIHLRPLASVCGCSEPLPGRSSILRPDATCRRPWAGRCPTCSTAP